jgi:fumarylacetoacetase
MDLPLNETHAPQLRSWLDAANRDGNDFPIQNLPLGVFRARGSRQRFRGGVAIGDQIVDLSALAGAALFSGLAADAVRAAAQDKLNAFLALGPDAWHALRQALSRALRAGAAEQDRLAACLFPQDDAEFDVPATIGDYTDFYTSVHHAENVGRLFRPDQPLLPNYKWVPIGYHGRASSIGISGQTVSRPWGQILDPACGRPTLRPTARLDFELELGAFIGYGNAPGQRIGMAQAEQHVFGLCLLNDWSARDIQAWEYQPLGPFLSKNFATTLSPWIVSLEALAPYRRAWARPASDGEPLPYLDSADNRAAGAFDITLQVDLLTARMREAGQAATLLCQTNYRHAYWTLAQMVAHHTVNGCPLRPGDLLGTGTLSGPAPTEAAALLELSQGGKRPLQLPGGETRTFLEDGDTVTLRGWAHRAGLPRIGFGQCTGQVVPA